MNTEPYTTRVFFDALKVAFFSNSRAYGAPIVSHFTSSLPDAPEEKEIPAAMLALVATAVSVRIATMHTLWYYPILLL